jgi:uncharacterized protein (DUF849 family)
VARRPPADLGIARQVRRLAARMRELDVKPELEIYDTGHLDRPVATVAEAESLLALRRAS